jgi:flagellar basal-body rod modification protein FlgD
MVNNIDSSYMLSNYQNKPKKTGSDVLGKDDFLKILMTQLQNQDPMNPMQDKDFVAQMATFSSLEQMTNMGKSMEQFVEVQKQNSMISYNQFVGKDVTWHKLSESTDGSTVPQIETGTGQVASIQFKENQVYLLLENGIKLEPTNISQVNAVSSENQMLQASMMIGKKITFKDSNNQDKMANVTSVSFKDGKTLFELNDEMKSKITASQINKIE